MEEVQSHFYILLVVTIFDALCFILDSYLIGYHVWTRRIGVTTYDHIIFKRER